MLLGYQQMKKISGQKIIQQLYKNTTKYYYIRVFQIVLYLFTLYMLLEMYINNSQTLPI